MTKPKLLIVEDEPVTRFMMSEFCDQLGYPHQAAASGAECLDLMRRRASRADIVLLDIHMPDLSGLETCVRLREAEIDHANAATIIATTADEFWHDPVHSIAAGFDSVLPKPISLENLRMALHWATPPNGPA